MTIFRRSASSHIFQRKTKFNLTCGWLKDIWTSFFFTLNCAWNIWICLQEHSGNETYSIFLQNAETVGLVCPPEGSSFSSSIRFFVQQIFPVLLLLFHHWISLNAVNRSSIPVTSLKVGDEVVIRVQGGARHTGIEIQEFILEKWSLQFWILGGLCDLFAWEYKSELFLNYECRNIHHIIKAQLVLGN